MALGLASTPLIFYESTTLESFWGDGVYTVTALQNFLDDIRYREINKVWWKILIPYSAFLAVRILILGTKKLKKAWK